MGRSRGLVKMEVHNKMISGHFIGRIIVRSDRNHDAR